MTGKAMRIARLANLAIVLALVGWPLMYYGAMSQLGDPSPRVPRADVVRQQQISMALMFLGIVCLHASLWFSGRSYPEAKKRSLLAVALVIAFGIAAYVSPY